MNTSLLTQGQGPIDGDIFARIIDALRRDGYIILNNVFSIDQLQSLFMDIKDTNSQYFHAAGVGREQECHVNPFVRRDRIRWLDSGHEPVLFYLDWVEQLRLHLNRALFLGLFDYECHYAHFPKGAFYKRHVDAFKGESSRRLSTILYLNPCWQPDDGGELVMYADEGQTKLETVLPTFGTMVLFLSEEFPHEVLPTKCSRYSLTGWLRIKGADIVN